MVQTVLSLYLWRNLILCSSWIFLLEEFSFFFIGRHIFASQPGIELNPSPLWWKHGVLTTGLPGKSLMSFYFFILH